MSVAGPCVDHGKRGRPGGYATQSRHNYPRYMHRCALADHLGVDERSLRVVRHKCDNPRCINPEHLEEGTYWDNTEDARVRGRLARGEAHGNAVLTDAQVDWVREVYVPRHPDWGGVALARKLGVSQPGISAVITGRNRSGGK